MTLNRPLLSYFVLLLGLLPSLPIPFVAIKTSMLLHMAVQIPLLTYAGYLLATFHHQQPKTSLSWPIVLSAWIWVYFTLIFWMLPIHLDKAIMFIIWDVFKIFSLLFSGALLSVAMRASLIWGAFFIGSTAIGLIFLGVYYQQANVRVCSNYLIETQQNTGAALFAWGILLLLALLHQSKNKLLNEH